MKITITGIVKGMERERAWLVNISVMAVAKRRWQYRVLTGISSNQRTGLKEAIRKAYR